MRGLSLVVCNQRCHGLQGILTCRLLASPASSPNTSIHIRRFKHAGFTAFLNALCLGTRILQCSSWCHGRTLHHRLIFTHSPKRNGYKHLLDNLLVSSMFWIVCLSSYTTLGMTVSLLIYHTV